MVYPVPVHACIACSVFFFLHTVTTEICTLSLHDALPISGPVGVREGGRLPRPLHAVDPEGLLRGVGRQRHRDGDHRHGRDRKSTRLNSSHQIISYAVSCLKKKILLWKSDTDIAVNILSAN